MAHRGGIDFAKHILGKAAELFSTYLVVALLCCFAPFLTDEAHAAVGPFDYDGDELAFISVDGKEFGMYRRQDGSWFEYQNGVIAVEHVTGNTTIYAGFYLEADISDSASWKEELFFPRNDGGWLSFVLDSSYAGKAWPIAPVKVSDVSATTSGQYYLAVPPLEKIPGYLLEVTFTDGFGETLDVQTVTWGGNAVPPTMSNRENMVFAGWDCSYENVTQSVTVNAVWMEDDATYHNVTFDDGWGNNLKTQLVKEGEAATPPGNPKHYGYTFTGWDSEEYLDVRGDLTVTATWTSDVEVARAAIAALPDTPKSVLRDTDNELVATACAAYSALPDDLKAQLSDDERLRLAKFAIAILPSDPYKVTTDYKPYIEFAQSMYDALSTEQQAELDSTDSGKTISSGRSYGRYLENAVWALDSLRTVNNVTTLKAGTYTGQVASESSMGKSSSRRGLTFTVKNVTVKDGRVMAIVEHSSPSSGTLRMGGEVYQNLETDPTKNSYYEIPINLNSIFHFAVKGKDATDDTDAITYTMTVSADESAMKPDSNSGGSASGGGNGSGSGSGSGSSNGSGSSSGSGSGSKSNASTGSKTSTATSSGTALTPTGRTAAASSSNATRTSSSGSSLSSLLRPTTSTTSSSKSKAAASKTSDAKSSTKSSATTGGTGSMPSGTEISEVELANPGADVSFADDVDLRPAVAGGCLLFISAGLLAFVLRFAKRESIFG